jgi:hypothetical protein
MRLTSVSLSPAPRNAFSRRVAPTSKSSQACIFSFIRHPPADTKYTGTVRLGFLQTAGPVTPNVTVKAGDKPGQTTVIALVSSRPGQRAMTIALVAEGAQQREIKERVQVAVRVTQEVTQ